MTLVGLLHLILCFFICKRETIKVSSLNNFLVFYSFLRERERERARARALVQVGEGQKKQGQKIQSRLRADSSKPDRALKLTNHKIMTWAEADAQPTEPPAPLKVSSLESCYED